VSAVVRVDADGAGVLGNLHGQCFDQTWDAATFRRLMDNDTTFALVIRSDDAGAVSTGFALVRVVAGEGELLTLGVAPPWRRRGVAAQLLAAAIDRAACAGAVAMVLEVAEDNIAARALYDNFAFAPIGRRARYYSRPAGAAADAITMKLTFDDQTLDALRNRSR
jgi:ribosomal-protein-alanine N-acetyltransferase